MLLSEACHGFYLYQITGPYSPVTAKNYRQFLSQFTAYLHDPDVNDIDAEMIRNFLVSLRSKGDSESSIQVYWKVIRSFYNWGFNELGLERPDLKIESPVFDTKVITPFSREEIEKLILGCRTKRDKAIIYLLLDTGLRVSEAARLTINDLDLESGVIIVRSYSTGKKSKSRVVLLGKASRRVIWSYLASRSDADKTDPLISTKNGSLERYQIRNILRRIALRSGVQNCHPHKFRHTFAIEYLRNGGDIFTLQELLGHRSLVMVRHYLKLSQMDIETAHRKASPVDKWRL